VPSELKPGDADRKAAAAIEDMDEDHPRYADLMAGKLDNWTMVQAFARHRLAGMEQAAVIADGFDDTAPDNLASAAARVIARAIRAAKAGEGNE
jgi:hypothetical protein